MAVKGNAHYYVTNDRPRRWIPLGSDYGEALVQWAKHEGQPVPETARTFGQISTWYELKVLPGKAPRTQKDNGRELQRLRAVFGESVIETIEPTDVRKYLDERVDEDGVLAPVRANREIALLSHVINWARDRGFTKMSNPCAGIQKNQETGRGRYVIDEEFQAIYDAGDEELRDAMDLLLLTSQRPGDIVRMTRKNIISGDLWIRQGKTGTTVRINVEGELEVAIERMLNRERKATSVYLIADQKGQPLTYWTLEGRFASARAKAAKTMPSVSDIQMRDLRGKAATDVEDLAHAQALLGHKSRAMTERYVKQRAGARVKPHSRKRRAG